MHEFIRGVEKHFKLTVTTANAEKQEIKKERELDKLKWERNDNPTAIWKQLALLTLKYKLTSPISEADKKKWNRYGIYAAIIFLPLYVLFLIFYAD